MCDVFYLCCEKFGNKDKSYRKLKDCCHFTRKYRGAPHSICNSRFLKKVLMKKRKCF